MSSITVTASVERFAVDGRFVIARGAQDHVDVVVVEAREGDLVGRGEGTPIYYEGETAELCVESIAMRTRQRVPLTRDSLLTTMAEGGARNALDCALWDLEAKRAGASVARLAGLAPAGPLETCFTLSVGTPAEMEAAARAATAYPILKIKLDGEDDRAKVAAVRKAAPRARLIADANESWDELDIEEEAAALAALGVEMIEQPVSAGEEELLWRLKSPIPFVADESCHTRDDLERCVDRFQGVNIKLDKAGGLTEALALAEAARVRGLDVMIGCMLATSLGIAPAALLGARARWIDLDGPLLLARDRKPGFTFADGKLIPPETPIWG
jgi:L-alanine-DL-glutamate epimerase-like enolase superfamily enzyme